MPKLILTVIAAVFVLIGCSQPSPTSGPTDTVGDAEVEESTDETRLLPTIYPTATSYPTPPPTNTRPPLPTSPPATPVDYDQLVVDLKYTIPAIGLERSLSGDVSGRLKIVDETTGFDNERRNQAGILLELQQSLPDLALDDLPEDCEHCVWLEYSLPLTGDQDQGWLQDVRMLASVENFMAMALGPHFPPGTIAGLRRITTQDQIAHTVALIEDGLLWRWKATESEVPEAENIDEDDLLLSSLISDLELSELAPIYAAACPDNAGIETLYIKSEDTERFIDLICPELALPTVLLPLYLNLDAKTVGMLDDELEGDYEPPLAQETILYYQTENGFHLTLFYDGQLFAGDDGGNVVSDTITVTLAVSLTDELLESGFMQPGVDNYLSGADGNYLIIRGPDGLYEQVWTGTAEPAIEAIVERLNNLLLNALSSAAADNIAEEESSNQETPAATSTITVTLTPLNTPTPGQ